MARRVITAADPRKGRMSRALLRELGVVTEARRKPDLSKLRKKYLRDLADLRALSERKTI